MSKDIGRNLVLSYDGTPIAGVRTKSLSVNNETIDFTDDDSNGWQTLSTAVGQRNVTVSVSGIYVDDALLDFSLGENIQGDFSLANEDGRTIAITGNITSYSESGEHTGAVTFEAEIESSGEVTSTVI